MADPSPGDRRRILGLVAGMFVLLAIQNAAGIWLNLFVVVNDTASYSGVYPAMFASVAGAVHTLIGIFIGLNAILALSRTWSWTDRRPRAVAIVSLLLVGLAAYLGYHFVQSGGGAGYSLGMELAFMGIVLCQAVLLYLVASAPAAPGASPALAPAAPTPAP